MNELIKKCMCIATAVLCLLCVALPLTNDDAGYCDQAEIVSPLDIRDRNKGED